MSFLKGGFAAMASAPGVASLNPHGEDPMTTPAGSAKPACKLARRLAAFSALLTATLLGSAVSSCAGDDAASADGVSPPYALDWGGQTGALLPPLDPNRCGPIVGPDGAITITEDSSFIIGARSASAGSDAGAPALSGWSVQDASGNTVELSSEVLTLSSATVGDETSTDVSVARPADALAAGDYSLVFQCDGVERITPLLVLAADPLPDPFFSSLAFSYEPSDYTCSSIDEVATLSLTLNQGAQRFTDSTQLSLRNSDVNLIIAPWGSLNPNLETQEIGIALCSEEQPVDCLPRTEQMLELVIEIVDQPIPPAAELLYLNAQCVEQVDAGTSSGFAEPESEPACSLANVATRFRNGSGLPALFVSFGLLLLARRRSRPV